MLIQVDGTAVTQIRDGKIHWIRQVVGENLQLVIA